MHLHSDQPGLVNTFENVFPQAQLTFIAIADSAVRLCSRIRAHRTVQNANYQFLIALFDCLPTVGCKRVGKCVASEHIIASTINLTRISNPQGRC